MESDRPKGDPDGLAIDLKRNHPRDQADLDDGEWKERTQQHRFCLGVFDGQDPSQGTECGHCEESGGRTKAVAWVEPALMADGDFSDPLKREGRDEDRDRVGVGDGTEQGGVKVTGQEDLGQQGHAGRDQRTKPHQPRLSPDGHVGQPSEPRRSGG